MRVFVDGSAGTTGLRLVERLKLRKDITLLQIQEEYRKNEQARYDMLNQADIAFLCLPDQASKETLSLVENPKTIVIDCSTAHRCDPDFAYGLPEISPKQRQKIINFKRIAVPGCHATGFISLIYPLIEANILDKSVGLHCFSITGYSGGGKSMIADYEQNPDEYTSPIQYALSQNHKHLAEIQHICELEKSPMFCPIVSSFYSGMELTISLHREELKHSTSQQIREIYAEKYQGKIISFKDICGEKLSANAMKNKDSMAIMMAGNEDRIVLIALYDNLGKGASGAALQCLNIISGNDEGLSLNI